MHIHHGSAGQRAEAWPRQDRTYGMRFDQDTHMVYDLKLENCLFLKLCTQCILTELDSGDWISATWRLCWRCCVDVHILLKTSLLQRCSEAIAMDSSPHLCHCFLWQGSAFLPHVSVWFLPFPFSEKVMSASLKSQPIVGTSVLSPTWFLRDLLYHWLILSKWLAFCLNQVIYFLTWILIYTFLLKR